MMQHLGEHHMLDHGHDPKQCPELVSSVHDGAAHLGSLLHVVQASGVCSVFNVRNSIMVLLAPFDETANIIPLVRPQLLCIRNALLLGVLRLAQWTGIVDEKEVQSFRRNVLLAGVEATPDQEKHIQGVEEGLKGVMSERSVDPWLKPLQVAYKVGQNAQRGFVRLVAVNAVLKLVVQAVGTEVKQASALAVTHSLVQVLAVGNGITAAGARLAFALYGRHLLEVAATERACGHKIVKDLPRALALMVKEDTGEEGPVKIDNAIVRPLLKIAALIELARAHRQSPQSLDEDTFKELQAGLLGEMTKHKRTVALRESRSALMADPYARVGEGHVPGACPLTILESLLEATKGSYDGASATPGSYMFPMPAVGGTARGGGEQEEEGKEEAEAGAEAGAVAEAEAKAKAEDVETIQQAPVADAANAANAANTPGAAGGELGAADVSPRTTGNARKSVTGSPTAKESAAVGAAAAAPGNTAAARKKTVSIDPSEAEKAAKMDTAVAKNKTATIEPSEAEKAQKDAAGKTLASRKPSRPVKKESKSFSMPGQLTPSYKAKPTDQASAIPVPLEYNHAPAAAPPRSLTLGQSNQSEVGEEALAVFLEQARAASKSQLLGENQVGLAWKAAADRLRRERVTTDAQAEVSAMLLDLEAVEEVQASLNRLFPSAKKRKSSRRASRRPSRRLSRRPSALLEAQQGSAVDIKGLSKADIKGKMTRLMRELEELRFPWEEEEESRFLKDKGRNAAQEGVRVATVQAELLRKKLAMRQNPEVLAAEITDLKKEERKLKSTVKGIAEELAREHDIPKHLEMAEKEVEALKKKLAPGAAPESTITPEQQAAIDIRQNSRVIQAKKDELLEIENHQKALRQCHTANNLEDGDIMTLLLSPEEKIEVEMRRKKMKRRIMTVQKVLAAFRDRWEEYKRISKHSAPSGEPVIKKVPARTATQRAFAGESQNLGVEVMETLQQGPAATGAIGAIGTIGAMGAPPSIDSLPIEDLAIMAHGKMGALAMGVVGVKGWQSRAAASGKDAPGVIRRHRSPVPPQSSKRRSRPLLLQKSGYTREPSPILVPMSPVTTPASTSKLLTSFPLLGTGLQHQVQEDKPMQEDNALQEKAISMFQLKGW
ncbi:unnamed protein product [Chrysoparadoxa australica]